MNSSNQQLKILFQGRIRHNTFVLVPYSFLIIVGKPTGGKFT